MLRKLLKLQTIIEEDNDDHTSNESNVKYEDRKPSWVKTIRSLIDNWLQMLPQVKFFFCIILTYIILVC